jgi:hypothetical protein
MLRYKLLGHVDDQQTTLFYLFLKLRICGTTHMEWCVIKYGATLLSLAVTTASSS